MRKLDMHKILYEIGGFRPANNRYHTPTFQTPVSIGTNTPFKANRYTTQEFKLTNWQQEIFKKVTLGREDLFVNVNPAGGKTEPIVRAWRECIKRGEEKKIVWVTPTKQLANQIYYSDLRQTFTKALPSLFGTPYGQRILPGIKDPNNLTTNEMNQLIALINQELLYFRAGGQSADGARLTPRTIAATCTYPYTAEIVRQMKPSIVIVDEIQEYVPINVGHDTKSMDEKADHFIKAMNAIPKSTQLIFLTGSMNGSTAQQMCDFMNSKFNRKFKSPFVAHAPNRAAISVVPHQKMRTTKDIKDLVKDSIRNKDIGNTCVLFSVRNQDWIGKKAIMPIAAELLKELPQRSIKQAVGAAPPPLNNVHGVPAHERRAKGTTDDNNKGQTSISDAASLSTTEHKNPRWQAAWLQTMLDQEGVPVPQGEHGPKGFPDPMLAKCLLAGFGYMAGGKDRDRGMHSRDIRLVQSMFEQGKIYFLLATDMIGVGTTLVVRKLYLPSLSKFQSHLSGFGEVDDSSLIQLINRVGRKSHLSATIYCDPDDVGRVTHMLNNDPHSVVQPAVFGNNTSSIERQSLKQSVGSLLQIIQSHS